MSTTLLVSSAAKLKSEIWRCRSRRLKAQRLRHWTYLDARFLTMIAVVGRLVTSVVCYPEVCNLQLTVRVET
jgi:hypothetical protein